MLSGTLLILHEHAEEWRRIDEDSDDYLKYNIILCDLFTLITLLIEHIIQHLSSISVTGVHNIYRRKPLLLRI